MSTASFVFPGAELDVEVTRGIVPADVLFSDRVNNVSRNPPRCVFDRIVDGGVGGGGGAATLVDRDIAPRRAVCDKRGRLIRADVSAFVDVIAF